MTTTYELRGEIPTTTDELPKMARTLDALAQLDADTRRDLVHDFACLERFNRAVDELIKADREMQAVLRRLEDEV